MDCTHSIDKPPGKSSGQKELLSALHHIFEDILPSHGYALREKQIALAEHILAVTAKLGVTLAESEVGTGKTHAYLIAATLAKRGRLCDGWLRGYYPRQSWAESAHMPVVISTSSIALQNAILTDYIPKLSDILLAHGIITSPLTAAVRKGKDHYICEKRLERFFATTDAGTQKLLHPFIGALAPFDLSGADKLTPHMKRRVCVSGSCGKQCSRMESCRYSRHLQEISSSKVDFQITNHNYFLADVLRRRDGKKPLLPHYQLVIIDEAHKLLQAARSMYGLELCSDELPTLTQAIHAILPDKPCGGVNVHRLAKKLKEQGDRLFLVLGESISTADDEAERFPATMGSDAVMGSGAGRYLKNLSNISEELVEALANSSVATVYGERKSKLLWRLGMLHERVSALRKQSALVHWFEKRVEGKTTTTALCAIPKDLGQRLYSDLWSSGIPMVLTSGTLSASGDFTRQKETLGLEKLPFRRLFSTTMPSPFDHKNNALLYISENVPFPDNKDKRYITAIAEEIERLVLASHGHAAVLFTSYSVMGQVHSLLKARKLPYPLFRLERGGVRAIEQFKKSGNGILLASGALWEGIDIPGDALSLLVIAKLPFAVPDPIVDYERSLYESMALYKSLCVLPDMLVKLKQGFGRLIRCENDTGVVALLDSRVRSCGAYRGHVLAALPDCRVTDDIRVVAGFFREKKPPAYFL